MKGGDDLDPEARALFREAMRGIKQQQHDRIHPHRRRPLPARRFPLEEDLSNDDKQWRSRAPATRYEENEKLLFTCNGLQRSVLRRLRRGSIPREAKIDLHGCRLMEAEQLLQRLLRESLQQGLRCLLVIHGKGLRSPNRKSILKRETAHWLRLYPGVLAFCPAQPRDGGDGALYVLLASRTTA